ncbi:MAG: extracellular solute-binding protein [Alphaproteobacteria bacterium]|nr:extracellular solute-binding protein [Alphaproteobacteria bacterium]MBL6939353.1 extracellular solute-binding protein [Alphaproteobacteria bacterium]MBL7097166.1 extracellular solute-binding protein [Alphaproteobacteria bacterium]
MNRRWIILGAVALLLAAAAGAYFWFMRPLPVLTVATWPGPYGRAQASAMFRTFGEANSYDVRIALYDGGLKELRQMVGRGQYDWDAVDLELPDAIAACRLGLLEHIDAAQLPAGADGVPSAKDFVKNAVGPCWTGSVVYSQVITYSTRRFPGASGPRTAADFFDLQHFPGTRALRRNAKFNLELALLADGMNPADVYDALLTPVGIDRALTKLSTLKGSLVWWDDSADAVAMVNDGRAAMATALNGDVYDAAQHHHAVGVVWDRQLYELDVFGVPKGTPRKDVAMDFVRFATDSQPLANVAAWVGYGPARRSALPLVGRNPETNSDMTPFLPTLPAHFATAFAVDDEWWQLHGADIESRWQVWLAQQ